MKQTGLLSFFLYFVFFACRPSGEQLAGRKSLPFQSPDQLFGQLFVDVQMNRVFPDGKTFVDCTPKSPPQEILKKYEAEKSKPGFDLKKFVLAHFDLPTQHASGFKSDTTKAAEDHINSLWNVLTRQPDQPVEGSSLLPLPHPYVVPGGRFGEVYYWDSYFTMQGLAVAGRQDLMENMLDNFAWLIDTVGFIPNGNRTYYLGRSQPPFFAAMVNLLAQAKGDTVYQKYLPALEKEYAFWMEGADNLSDTQPAHRRVVRLADGSILNRYWDDRAAPRPESYREDVETAEKSGRPVEEVYRHLRAGAESGWDFSSRWFADGKTLASIHTTDIVPVDLNALIFNLETTLSLIYQNQGNTDKANFYQQQAVKRSAAVNKYCWQPTDGFFHDYDFVKGEATPVLSLAAVYPLYFRMASPNQAQAVAQNLQKNFLRDGGLLSTPYATGQQWDAPNGWAPLQWLTILGLRNYGENALANVIKKRWTDLNVKVFHNTGKMVEKYNVQDVSLEAGGGEYPVQDGFGWTNGVLLKLLSEKIKG